MDSSSHTDDLIARAAITDLVYTYALNVRQGNGAESGKLFTDDGIFEVQEVQFGTTDTPRQRTRVVGQEAISTHLARASSARERVCPTIHNLLIRVNGNEAVGNCVMTSMVWPTGQHMIGQYEDSFKFQEIWRFSTRRFTILSGLPSNAAQSR